MIFFSGNDIPRSEKDILCRAKAQKTYEMAIKNTFEIVGIDAPHLSI